MVLRRWLRPDPQRAGGSGRQFRHGSRACLPRYLLDVLQRARRVGPTAGCTGSRHLHGLHSDLPQRAGGTRYTRERPRACLLCPMQRPLPQRTGRLGRLIRSRRLTGTRDRSVLNVQLLPQRARGPGCRRRKGYAASLHLHAVQRLPSLTTVEFDLFGSKPKSAAPPGCRARFFGRCPDYAIRANVSSSEPIERPAGRSARIRRPTSLRAAPAR